MQTTAKRKTVNITDITNDLCRSKTTVLDYSGCNLSDVEASMLAARFFINSTVNTVLLGNNHVGDRGVQLIAEMLKSQPIVKKLDLSDNPISNKGLTALAELKLDRPDLEIAGPNLPVDIINEAKARQISSASSLELSDSHARASVSEAGNPAHTSWRMIEKGRKPTVGEEKVR